MTSLTGERGPQDRPRAGGQEECEHCATRSVCLLAPLDVPQLRQLQPAIRQRSFRKGEVLVEEHTRPDTVHVVKVGLVFGVRRGLDGEIRPVGLWGRGTTFGLSSYYGEPSQLSGIAATAGRSCSIDIAGLLEEVRRNPALGAGMQTTMARAFGNIAAWSEALRLPGVTRQLAYAMLLLCRGQQSLSIELPDQKSLAALLGTSRESIARAMAQLEQDGIVQRRGRRLCEVVRERALALLATQARPGAETEALTEPDALPA